MYILIHLKGAIWKKELIESYKQHYGIELNIPRWMDIKDNYKKQR